MSSGSHNGKQILWVRGVEYFLVGKILGNLLVRKSGNHDYLHWNLRCSRVSGFDLLDRQEDGREEPGSTAFRQAGPDRHCAPGGGRRSHLSRTIQRVPSDGPVHIKRRRYGPLENSFAVLS